MYNISFEGVLAMMKRAGVACNSASMQYYSEDIIACAIMSAG